MFKIQTRHIKLNEAFWTNFRYADVMCSVLNNQFGYLIASIEREVDSPGCMPHSLSFDDVKDLFGKLLHFSSDFTHCYLRILLHKRISTFQFPLRVFLDGIHQHTKQKEFFNCYDAFLK